MDVRFSVFDENIGPALDADMEVTVQGRPSAAHVGQADGDPQLPSLKATQGELQTPLYMGTQRLRQHELTSLDVDQHPPLL
jgi:hypothetical protein